MPVPVAKVQNSLAEHGFRAWAVFRRLGYGPGSAITTRAKYITALCFGFPLSVLG